MFGSQQQFASRAAADLIAILLSTFTVLAGDYMPRLLLVFRHMSMLLMGSEAAWCTAACCVNDKRHFA